MGKNLHATIPKGNMGYDHNTVPNDCTCRTYFCCFPPALENTFPWPFVPILSNFFEEQRTQNHPQLSIVACTFSDNLSRNSCIYLLICLYLPHISSFPFRLFFSLLFGLKNSFRSFFSGQVFQMFRKQSLFY